MSRISCPRRGLPQLDQQLRTLPNGDAMKGLHAMIFILACSSVGAQEVVPKRIDLADQADVVSDVANKAKNTNILSPDRRFVVEGDTVLTSQLLTAREIVFKPKSRLIFSDSGPNTAGQFFIVVDRLLVEDPYNPGIITWARATPPTPPDRGQAGPGSAGAGEGAGGGAGPSGATGSTGAGGGNAPALTMMIRNVGKGGLVIDMQGAPGGKGGAGQVGGQGGSGAQGSPARQSRAGGPFNTTIWLPSCESGPGRGGNGGTGGAGGSGGLGGRGGNGGNVTLVSTPASLPTLFQAIRVNIGGGVGGSPGDGGSGGSGGSGGPEGQLANFCNSAGRVGLPGGSGAPGPVGTAGEPGRAGQPYVSTLEDAQFTALFGF